MNSVFQNGGLAPWPESAAALEEEQKELGRAAPRPWNFPPTGRGLRVAACFVCFPAGGSERRTSAEERRLGRLGDPAWAAAALLEEGRPIDLALVRGTASAAYDAGHLALREGPVLEAAILGLVERPHVLMVNATGRDHPRRAGLALHLGARLRLPTVGVTNRLLVASGAWPENAAGSRSEIRLADEVVGVWFRVRRDVRPLAIHAAWRTDAPAALAVVQACLGRARTPLPMRLARRAAREARHRQMLREGRDP